MRKRDKIREMKKVRETITALEKLQDANYQRALKEFGLIDDAITFDFFYNNAKDADRVLDPTHRVSDKVKPLYTPVTRSK